MALLERWCGCLRPVAGRRGPEPSLQQCPQSGAVPAQAYAFGLLDIVCRSCCDPWLRARRAMIIESKLFSASVEALFGQRNRSTFWLGELRRGRGIEPKLRRWSPKRLVAFGLFECGYRQASVLRAVLDATEPFLWSRAGPARPTPGSARPSPARSLGDSPWNIGVICSRRHHGPPLSNIWRPSCTQDSGHQCANLDNSGVFSAKASTPS